ncbi:hypothetical protein J8L88_00970 [Aquimarina sp. MMG015]|uniref:hypothetical protein n=1 Tax=Aquimarina sp. MMG015 TaxID=2822689 RepID=UPI001B3A70FF|nr:hypothetical protein [Aquimarina sp. MMG015]MBQ4801403.1 hypothetical protein [Aquimarina sp. MMG015]
MKAKLIIASPLQLINAIEAKEHLEIKSTDITFFSDGNTTNERQVKLLLEELKIKTALSIIKIPKNLNFLERMLFLKNLEKHKLYNNYEYIIIGHFRSIYQAAFANLYNTKYICVDDGTRTLDDISFLNRFGYSTKAFKLKTLLYAFFSVKPYLLSKKYTFFSYYAKKVEVKNHIHVLENTFSYMRSLKSKKSSKVEKKIAFVGQSLVDSKLLTLDFYLSLLNNIDDYYKKRYPEGITVEYYAHRNESDEVLELVAKMPNWVIIKNKLPLELHFLFSSQFPEEVGLFFSSVAETLSIILGDELKLRSFFIPTDKLLYRKSEINNLFETNRNSENIQLINNY